MLAQPASKKKVCLGCSRRSLGGEGGAGQARGGG